MLPCPPLAHAAGGQPRHALLRAAVAVRRCMLGQPPSPAGDGGKPRGVLGGSRGLRFRGGNAKMLLNYLLCVLRGAKQGTTLRFQLHNLLAQNLVMRIHPQDTSAHPTWNLRPIPSRSDSSCSGNLFRLVSRLPWLLSQPLRRVVVLARSRFSVATSQCRCRRSSASTEGTCPTRHPSRAPCA
jgi:hypothetical protein